MSREQIAEVLKGYRMNRGLSVQQVCNWLLEKGHDIKPKTIYSYESGHRQPDADVLMMLCELYEVNNILQAFGYGKLMKTNEPYATQSDESLKEITIILSKLNSDARYKVMQYATDLFSSGRYTLTDDSHSPNDDIDNQYLFDNGKIMLENIKSVSQTPAQKKAAK